MNTRFAFYIRVLNKEKDGYEESNLLEPIFKKVSNRYKLKFVDAYSFNQTGLITTQVLRAIEDADIVFADINSSNENVWYEIGYAHRIDPNKVISIYKQNRILPFDIQGYRSFSYSIQNIANGEFTNRIENTVEHVLSIVKIDRLLKKDHYQIAVKEYMDIFPNMKDNIIDHLNFLCFNIEKSPEIRKRALLSLLEIGYANQKLLDRFSETIVDENIRISLYKKIPSLLYSPSESFWLKGLDKDNTHSLLRTVAKSGVATYLNGYMDEVFFTKQFLKHENWVVRKHITLYFLEHIDITSLKFLEILIKDKKEEITNRFIEDWYERTIREKKKINLSNEELKLLKMVYSLCKFSQKANHQQDAKEIENFLHTSKWL